MPIAKPCPASCTFDWKKFHNQLDIAMAHMIEEADTDTPSEDYLPSQVSVMRFAKYSKAKVRLQELNQTAPDAEKKP